MPQSFKTKFEYWTKIPLTHAGCHVLMCLVDCNSFSVITRPVLLNLRGVFPVCFIASTVANLKCWPGDWISFWWCKSLLEHVIPLNSPKWWKTRCWCYGTVILTVFSRNWTPNLETLEYCKVNLDAAQHQPVLLCLCLGHGDRIPVVPGVQGCHLPCRLHLSHLTHNQSGCRRGGCETGNAELQPQIADILLTLRP